MGFRVLAILSCRRRWPWLSCAVICRAAGYMLGDNEQQLIVGCSGGWGAGITVAGFFPWMRSWHSPLVRGSNALISVTHQRYSTLQSHFFCSVSMTFCSLNQLDSEKECFMLSGMHPLSTSKRPSQVWMIFSEKWDVGFVLNQMYKAGVHNTQHYRKLERKPTFISELADCHNILTCSTCSLHCTQCPE